MIRRAGGPGTHEQVKYAGSTCESYCTFRNVLDGNGGEYPCCGHHPIHIKCYDAYQPTPLNSIRIAFASQVGTNGIDPALPLTNLSQVSECMRVHIISLSLEF